VSESIFRAIALAAALALGGMVIEARVQIATMQEKLEIKEDVRKNTEHRIAWNAKWPEFGSELARLIREMDQ
jgi:hypothetical protein